MNNEQKTMNSFTIVELLTVMAIIAILVGVLVPTITVVRNMAKETKQKAQLAAIDQALLAFRGDDGDYPPSNWLPGSVDYCGGQKLAEALVGWDLLGFHPDSDWDADGDAYDPLTPSDDNLDERKGLYLELGTANAFRLGNISVDKPGLFDDTGPLAPDTFVICDIFGIKKVTIGGKTVKVGAPILYYRAERHKNTIEPPAEPKDRIYNAEDNRPLIQLKKNVDGKPHLLGDIGSNYSFFYEYIKDPKVTARDWPYRADSYILISAGVDGEYGTRDDITNFGN